MLEENISARIIPFAIIDAYVDELDLFRMGFERVQPKAIEAVPAYHPSILLKLYIYGYT